MQLDKRGRPVCWCTGYWFPHRKGGGACEHSKTRDIHMAIRMGCQELLTEALIAYRLKYPGTRSDVCPF